MNYGHTIGHAIESVTGFGIGHGEAVAIGMLAAARISKRLGILDIDELTRLKSLIKRADLTTAIAKLELERITQAMRHDKKISGGKIRFVLPKAIGEVFVTDEVSPVLVAEVLVGWNEET